MEEKTDGIHTVSDNAQAECAKAMIELLARIERGFRSGEEEGWYTTEEVRAILRARRAKMQ